MLAISYSCCPFVYILEDAIVAFSVTLTDDISIAEDEQLPFDRVITNVGAGYDVGRREFVCGEPGVYAFYSVLDVRGGYTCWTYIAKNGLMDNTHVRMWAWYGEGLGSNMVVFELTVGDTVAVHRGSSGCTITGGNPYTTFSGFIIN